MHYGELETFAIALLTIMNPIGSAAIFAGMTRDRPAAEVVAIARRTGIAAAIFLLTATWLGEPLLAFFSISVPMFEVAGGLVVLRLGLGMLQSEPGTGTGGTSVTSIAIVPLAMPIVVGPDAMCTVIIQTHKLPHYADNLIITATCLALALLTWLCLRAAGPICHRLGPGGVSVLTRILGLLLAAVAVGMIATGAQELFPGLR